MATEFCVRSVVRGGQRTRLAELSTATHAWSLWGIRAEIARFAAYCGRIRLQNRESVQCGVSRFSVCIQRRPGVAGGGITMRKHKHSFVLPNGLPKVASALAITLIAGAAATIVNHAARADTCLTRPNVSAG